MSGGHVGHTIESEIEGSLGQLLNELGHGGSRDRNRGWNMQKMEIPDVNWLFTSDPRSALYNLSVGSVTRCDVIMKKWPVVSRKCEHHALSVCVARVLICVMH